MTREATSLLSREHAAELGRLAAEARERRRARFVRLPFLVWRAASVVRSSRELLTPYAPVLPLASLPFLAATAIATVAALLELVIAFVVLVALAIPS